MILKMNFINIMQYDDLTIYFKRGSIQATGGYFMNIFDIDYSRKEKDIIQEIILKYYLDNKKQTRKDILKTYFTNTNSKQKFKNKQEIENAIRNINDEMDEAQKEFSKLFISNDYTK